MGLPAKTVARLAALAVIVFCLATWLAGAALFARGIQADLDGALRLVFGPGWTPAALREAARALGVPASLPAWFWLGMEAVLTVTYGATGLLLFWRKPDGFGAFLGAALVLIGTRIAGPVSFALGQALPAWRELLVIQSALAYLAFASLLYVFPDGRPVPGWSRWLVAAVSAYALYRTLAGALFNSTRAQALDLAIIVGLFGAGVLAQLYRFARISGPLERQQTKWALASFALFLLVAAGGMALVPNVGLQTAPPTAPDLAAFIVFFTLLTGAMVLFIAALGRAILRYRLWDLGLIVRRTLIYTALTALLALVYFGSVVLLQSVFLGLNAGRQSQLATVLSTLALAALAAPLHGRVQAFIDRRFYRRKYDAARILVGFAGSVRDETDLEALTGRLVQVVQETMEPASVGVWLRPGAGRRPGP